MIIKEKVREETTKWVAARPITFVEFLDVDLLLSRADTAEPR
jgi:hypothetical protein